MPSKLEEVVNQIARLQQMRSAGEISESEYTGLKEDVLDQALPGHRGREPVLFDDDSLPQGDTQDEHDASALKRALPVIAVLAVIAAPLVIAGFYFLAARPDFTRGAGGKGPAPPPRIAARVQAPAPAPAPETVMAPETTQEGANKAPLPDTQSQAVAPAAPSGSDTAQTGAAEASLPTRIGQCAQTVVTQVTRRAFDASGAEAPSSGSAIQYRNGGRQISAAQIGGIDASMPGDQIRLCLVSRTDPCSGGGRRGSVYRAVNLRTGEDWEAADSVQSCSVLLR